MNGVTTSDLALLVPELILVGMALVLILSARRIQGLPWAVVGTVLAALAAAVAKYRGTERVDEPVQADGNGTGLSAWVLADRLDRLGRRRSRR